MDGAQRLGTWGGVPKVIADEGLQTQSSRARNWTLYRASCFLQSSSEKVGKVGLKSVDEHHPPV